LILLLLTNSIAYSQSTSVKSLNAITENREEQRDVEQISRIAIHDFAEQYVLPDTICIRKDKAVECIRCLMNQPVKDSLIVRLQEKNEIQAGAIENLVDANDKQADVIVLKDQRIEGLNEEMKKRTLFAGIISGIGGVVVGWLVSLF